MNWNCRHITNGNADNQAEYQPPTVHTGIDGSHVTVLRIGNGPGDGLFVAQLVLSAEYTITDVIAALSQLI